MIRFSVLPIQPASHAQLGETVCSMLLQSLPLISYDAPACAYLSYRYLFQVYVWHTRTETPIVNINGEKQLIKKGKPSNPEVET